MLIFNNLYKKNACIIGKIFGYLHCEKLVTIQKYSLKAASSVNSALMSLVDMVMCQVFQRNSKASFMTLRQECKTRLPARKRIQWLMTDSFLPRSVGMA